MASLQPAIAVKMPIRIRIINVKNEMVDLVVDGPMGQERFNQSLAIGDEMHIDINFNFGSES